FTTALLRKKETTKEDYNTAFYSNLAISVFLFILFILLSGVIANFFNEPILRKIVPAMSVLLIINAISL
ncbi:MAG TPA: flippase, partial [Bacteroidales bacterium]|nr:flippase [Bacteroidales bacterium]